MKITQNIPIPLLKNYKQYIKMSLGFHTVCFGLSCVSYTVKTRGFLRGLF